MAGTRDSKAAMQARLEATGLYRLQQGDLVLGELAAYAAGLDWLWQQLEVLEQECFIATAQEDGLLLREQAAGALPGGEADTQTRRDMLLAMGTIQRKDIDLQSVGKALRACGVEAQLAELTDGSLQVTVTQMQYPYTSQELAKRRMNQYLPVGITTVFIFPDDGS